MAPPSPNIPTTGRCASVVSEASVTGALQAAVSDARPAASRSTCVPTESHTSTDAPLPCSTKETLAGSALVARAAGVDHAPPSGRDATQTVAPSPPPVVCSVVNTAVARPLEATVMATGRGESPVHPVIVDAGSVGAGSPRAGWVTGPVSARATAPLVVSRTSRRSMDPPGLDVSGEYHPVWLQRTHSGSSLYPATASRVTRRAGRDRARSASAAPRRCPRRSPAPWRRGRTG